MPIGRQVESVVDFCAVPRFGRRTHATTSRWRTGFRFRDRQIRWELVEIRITTLDDSGFRGQSLNGRLRESEMAKHDCKNSAPEFTQDSQDLSDHQNLIKRTNQV